MASFWHAVGQCCAARRAPFSQFWLPGASRADQEISLAPRERALAELLLRESGRVVSKRKLETALSEFGSEMSANALELAVSRLRKRLEPFDTGITIETVRGIGYLLRVVT
jgi:two-component system, OmpR family, response regulator